MVQIRGMAHLERVAGINQHFVECELVNRIILKAGGCIGQDTHSMHGSTS
jgi:hypothetical protein